VVPGDGGAPGERSSPVNDTARFLSRFPPFDTLERTELERVAEAVVERAVQPGVRVLVEDGPPGDALFVVRSGSMELLRNDRVVDVITQGEVFGHPTLLTGLSPAFSVRCREDAVVYVIPRAVALEILSSQHGVAFVAETLRERLSRTIRSVRAAPEVRAVHVSSLIRRPPVFVDPDAPISAAAKVMSEELVRAVLVLSPQGLGIVTEGDLRDKVLAAGLAPDAPVSTIMTMPVRTMRSDTLAPQAAIEMMQAGVNHMPVVDARGKVLGVVSSGSLMRLDALSPFALQWSLSVAKDEDEVVALGNRVPQLFLTLLDANLEARDVSRVLTVQNDAAVTRLLQLAIERHGAPPVAYAWLALGSVARSETTVASDQDNALAYADTDDPTVDAYFEKVAAEVNAGLARCGCGLDISDVLARNRVWRKSESEWIAVFADCLEHPDHSNLVRAALTFDFRRVTGELDIVKPLVELLRAAPEHPGFLARLARTVTEVRSPLGFRQRLIGPVDLKKSAALPIENLARFHGLSHRVTVSATLDRLAAIEGLGALSSETVKSLQEAFTIIWDLRLEQHAAAMAQGRAPDNVVDTDRLPPLARLDLQAALRAVAAAQKQLSHYAPLGM
jgi:CBS domain-containing protein